MPFGFGFTKRTPISQLKVQQRLQKLQDDVDMWLERAADLEAEGRHADAKLALAEAEALDEQARSIAQ